MTIAIIEEMATRVISDFGSRPHRRPSSVACRYAPSVLSTIVGIRSGVMTILMTCLGDPPSLVNQC